MPGCTSMQDWPSAVPANLSLYGDVSVERRVWALTQLEAWCDSPGKLCRAAHLELEGAFKLKMRKRKAHYLLFLPLTHGEAGPGLERQWELKWTSLQGHW